MLNTLARKIFGSANERAIQSMQLVVQQVNGLEAEIKALSNEQLKHKTQEFRGRLDQGEKLDALLPEAFAVVREASVRTLGLRHFDVQLMGGLVLHRGQIAEMKTGEGKTLVSTLAAYLNALPGTGVHIVTVNDYLAQRDAGWMGKIHEFLGLSVGVITNGITEQERQAAYSADITYGTNNEFGFDYLRDNMKFELAHRVQRPFNFAIVDEVDSILIDEARTPLIISGPTEDSSELYRKVNEVIPKLKEEDYDIDEKSKAVSLTEEGTEHVEQLLKEAGMIDEQSNLYDLNNAAVVHHVNQSLRAHHLFSKDVDYIVKDRKVVIIDEFTGRMMEGRRYGEGLHQALEAKEGAIIQNENQTLASVTFQNYFRLYPKLAGMTGTAMTESAEFKDIYNLDVIEMPTHQPVRRVDEDDLIYRTAEDKHNAIITKVKELNEKGQPVLVGTVSIEKSELLSKILKKHKIKHNVLNARYHETEASIIAQAGRKGAVTIATNMAGRGTDIMLGGNADMRIAEELADVKDAKKFEAQVAKIQQEVEKEKAEVLELGGLYVIATERHESRRIDNQLRGRSGRQGDPGASLFYLSLEDDLMRIFGGERMDAMLQKLGMEEGEAIYHPWMNKALERAQQKVEARNYDIRKNLLKFDDVMNDQRTVIYDQRKDLMEAEDVSETIVDMREEVLDELVASCMPDKSYADEWDVERLQQDVFRLFNLTLPITDWAAEEGVADIELKERLEQEVQKAVEGKQTLWGPELMRMAEKRVLLHTLDQLWKEHLHNLDHVRQGIGLRAYAQRDPLHEYKQEAFGLFEGMLSRLREEVVMRLSHLELQVEHAEDALAMPERDESKYREGHSDLAAPPEASQQGGVVVTTFQTRKSDGEADPANPDTWGRVRRNDPCPCGSDKKYKHCHGSL